ncbi:MAG: polyphosphate kinase 1 [Saprospiraceae bacterium]|nr:polyphosphate kinase 1 [Saprospiraceae bacterium]
MAKNKPKYAFHDREISWLAFNHRVLQEAIDESNPLYERIKFLGIYHNNLDEFFRVRVAAIKSMQNLKSKTQRKLKFVPSELLQQIFRIVSDHYTELDDYFYNNIIPELKENDIYLLNERQLNEEQAEYITEFAYDNILPFIQPSLIEKGKILAFLKNRSLYLALSLKAKDNGELKYAYVEIPTWEIDRFVPLPSEEGTYSYMVIDDAIRFLMPKVFPGYTVEAIHSFMLNRDAELYIDDEFKGNLVDKIKKSLAKRESGSPIGFLYDRGMPVQMLLYITEAFGIDREAFLVGSKYFKMSDFMGFPNPKAPELENEKWEPLPDRNFEKYDSMFDAVKAKDRLLSYPYQRFDYALRLLKTAANDERVRSINITLYRTSENSQVAQLLIEAAQNQKEVTAFVEVKARFDERVNMKWAEKMEAAGVQVIYSLPLLKVHSKLLLISREENQGIRRYGYFSTGNFNGSTAKIYGDHALITADDNICFEASKIFEILSGAIESYEFEHLMVAPNHMRTKIYELIEFEMEQALQGKPASMMIKLNSLEDRQMINKLYQASNAGVKIDMIIRGICCLVPGVPGQSENINIISIVDRYLEHARIYKFHHAGKDLIYISSADLMKRNLSRRIEVAVPIYEQDVKMQLNKVLKYQWGDNQKARIVNQALDNQYVENTKPPLQSQSEIYSYFEELSQSKRNKSS